MTSITEALSYLTKEKPEVSKNFLEALSLSQTALNSCTHETDEVIIDFYISKTFYVITSICETIKVTYSQYAAAEDILFSDKLPHATSTQLRNYLYHECRIPKTMDEKLKLSASLCHFLYHLSLSFYSGADHSHFATNAFLVKVNYFLNKSNDLTPFGGKNIFLKANSLKDICISFPKEIYPIKPYRSPIKHKLKYHNNPIKQIIFKEKNGFFGLLNSFEKANTEFQDPISIDGLSKNIKKQIESVFTDWINEAIKQIDVLIKTVNKERKMIEGIQQSLKDCLSTKPNFEEMKYYDIANYLSDKLNQINQIHYLTLAFKIDIFKHLSSIIQKEHDSLLKLLSENSNEIDAPDIKYYRENLNAIYTDIHEAQALLKKEELEKIATESHYSSELSKALHHLLYHNKPQYNHLLNSLLHAISLQPSYYIPHFIKKFSDLVLNVEEKDKTSSFSHEVFLSELDHHYTRTIEFFKIFGSIVKNQSLIQQRNAIPLFGAEIYLTASMNAGLKFIENIEKSCTNTFIQTHIAYLRSQLGMRDHQKIHDINPNKLNFFELISSYSGIGKSIATFRHYSTTLSLDHKIKQNIELLYAAFENGTPYQTPTHLDAMNFTYLFETNKIQNHVTPITALHKAKKIMTLLCFDRVLNHELSLLTLSKMSDFSIDRSNMLKLSMLDETEKQDNTDSVRLTS